MKNAVKTHFQIIGNKTITCSTENGFTENSVDLYSIIEDLISDGQKAQIKEIRVFIRGASTINDNFPIIVPIVVQTNGTWTDTVNIAEGDLSTMLDGCIDDEFGYQLIGDAKCAILRNNAGATPDRKSVLEYNVRIPQNVINLLNKEQQTERLQSLFMGIAGVQLTSGAFSFSINMIVKYIEVRKGITIR